MSKNKVNSVLDILGQEILKITLQIFKTGYTDLQDFFVGQVRVIFEIFFV